MKNKVFRLYLFGWRLVIANCPVKVKKNRDCISKREHRQLKSYTYEKAGGVCECCGRHLEYNEAEMHHIMPVSMAPELVSDKSNLMCICRSCHQALHANPFAYVRQIREHYPQTARLCLN